MKYHFSIFYFCIGAIIIAFYELDELFLNNFFGGKIDYILPIGFILLIYGASLMMLEYLKGSKIIGEQNKEGSNPDNNQKSENLYTKEKSIAIEDEIKKINELNELRKLQLASLAGDSNINQEVFNGLLKKFVSDAEKIKLDNSIREAFHRAQKRLLAELSELGRRSNLNLVIGVITTSIAAGLLSYMVLNSPPNFESITSVLSHYLPRFMLVIFIEVFSFFFLRLYRATLAEIRIYQTDLTNLTLQEVAVFISLSSGDVSAVINLSNNLTSHKSSTEHEKIEKSEKTTDKADSSHQILVELMEKIIKSAPKKGKEE